jgi:hypothetical protein
MDLNNIELTPQLAASWYSFTLVDNFSNETIEKPEPITRVTETAEPAFKFLGSNGKNILLIVNYSDATHLPDEELTFLTSILTACKLDLGDVAIVNRNNYPDSFYKDYKDHFNSKIVLLFGIDPVSFGLPVDFPQFQVQSFANTTFLYSPPLEERKKDQLFKSKLWVCLKRIFSI